MYSQGDINEFTFIEKGTWVLAELTEEAIKSKKYSEQINYLLEKKVVSQENEFRFMVKVISKEEFIENIKGETGKIPIIRTDLK